MFPQVFKSTVVVPVHKGKNPNDVSNYRTISLTTHLAKVLRKCANKK